MPEKKPKQRSPNLLAGALANEIVRLRAKVQRHESALQEARVELSALEKGSDPTVLKMALALLSATLVAEAPVEGATLTTNVVGKAGKARE